MKRLLKTLLEKYGYAMVPARDHYFQDGLFSLHNDAFRRDQKFRTAYARGVAASDGVDPRFEWRVHTAIWAAQTALRVPGDFVECGVNAGFISSAIMQYLDWPQNDKRFFLIHTFSGPILTQYAEQEAVRLKIAEAAIAKGAYVTDLERVRANYSEWRNVEVIQGVVPEVLPVLGARSVAFLHIDMNCAFPERAALEHFWPLLSPGAMVLFDDYAYLDNNRATEAIDSAAALLGARILSLPTGQGMIIK